MGILLRTSYHTTTPESIEHGDYAESGWINEEGTEYGFRELVNMVYRCENHDNRWISELHSTDLRTGEEIEYNYHPVSPRDIRYFEKALKMIGAYQ